MLPWKEVTKPAAARPFHPGDPAVLQLQFVAGLGTLELKNHSVLISSSAGEQLPSQGHHSQQEESQEGREEIQDGSLSLRPTFYFISARLLCRNGASM